MNQHTRFLCLLALVIVSVFPSAHAQLRAAASHPPDGPVAAAPVPHDLHGIPAGTPAVPYESDILAARPIRWHLGLGAGGYLFQHLGWFSPSCDCRFEGEKGAGPMIALEGAVTFPKLNIGARVLISYVNASAEFTRSETRPSVIVGDDPDVLIEYRNSSDVRLKYLSIAPTFAWYIPYSPVYLLAGIDVGIMLAARYNHVERIVTPGYLYADGSPVTVLLPDGTIPSGTHLRAALTASLGIDIAISESFSLSPRIGVSYPLTGVSSEDPEWLLVTEHALLTFRLRLK